MPSPGRIHTFDWLRGIAVVVMLQTHSLGLLRPELTHSAFHQQLVAIDGLVAPSFIFSAGFALALVQVRAARAGRREGQARKSLKRIGEVALVASVVNLIWFPITEPRWLLRIDILQCIALSLLALLPVLVGLATRPRWLRWVTLLLALAIFFVSPLGEQVTGFFQLFTNTGFGWLDDTTGSTFPLLPWSGYVFLGASFGAVVGAMDHERELWRWLGLLGVIGVLLWVGRPLLEPLYPAHHFWVTNPSNAGHRFTRVLALVAVLRLAEQRWPSLAERRPVKALAAFGASSLSAYFFHEMLLFQRHVGVFSKLFREKAGWPLYWALVAALVALTWLCVRAWDRIEPHVRARLTSSGAPPRPAS